MAHAQMTLEKLSLGQIIDINKRAEQSGESERIYVMTAEELELYKGNCNEYIGTAKEAIAKTDNKQVIIGQQSVIDRYAGELEIVEAQLKKIKSELNQGKIEKSTTEVELIDGQIIYLGVMELSKFLGWSKQRVSAAYKDERIETPAAMVGQRPLWTPSQATRIKEALGL